MTLLQTDKAVYKPGQDVKFRVMSLYGSDLLLIRGKVRKKEGRRRREMEGKRQGEIG